MNAADTNLSMESRHKKEKKELQAHIQALKKIAKNDKSKKKDTLSEISRLEIEMDNRHKQELQSLELDDNIVNNDVEEDHHCLEHDVAIMKISKAQKRRDKKNQLEKEREELIKLQEKENVNGPRNKEIQDLTAKLKVRKLKIYPIPSDGDCLYKAVAHQLLTIKNLTYTAEELRTEVASYMKLHKDDFLPFMTNPETFQMLTDNEFESYCDRICNTKMWGGQLEIRALSNSIKCPITVIQAEGPESIEQGSEFPGPTLVITYHRHMYRLGEHYNSTCLNEDEDAE